MKQPTATRMRWPDAQHWDLATLLLLALTGWALLLQPLQLPWGASRASLQPGTPQRMGLAQYQASIQAQAVVGIDKNLSGLTYSAPTGTLFAVTNSPPAVAEISTKGQLLRLLPLHGIQDTEGIAHIQGDWFAIADERHNRIHWVQIGPHQRDVQAQPQHMLPLDGSAIHNFALEGLGWDTRHQQLLAVQEKWPLRVLAVQTPWANGTPQIPQSAVHEWPFDSPVGMPSTDAASIEADPRTGNMLLLGEESSVLYEYTPGGRLLGLMPLWADMNGLDDYIPQPEGVALDADGSLYIVSEPNLFYRFDKKS